MKTLDEIKIQLESLKPILKDKFQVETIGILAFILKNNRNLEAT